jgi:hypothetical protein
MYRERRCRELLERLGRFTRESDHAQAVSDLLVGELDPVEARV